MGQTINLRVNSIQDNGEQVYCTLLMNGIPVGHMAFTVGEYQIFAAALLIGIKKTGVVDFFRPDNQGSLFWPVIDKIRFHSQGDDISAVP